MAEQDRCPLARLPWISLNKFKSCSDKKDKKLEDSYYFKQIMTKNGSRCLEVYNYMNLMFPFFLPRRYHTMDCRALLKGSSGEQYFSNAYFFLLSTHLHGPSAWKYLRSYRESQPNLKNLNEGIKPLICPELRRELLRDSPEQCESGAEFLLEPWVIVQLPYQPVILHQWLVAALGGVCKLHSETADFKYLPVPISQNQEMESAIQAVQLIHANLLALELCIFNGFNSLGQVSEANLYDETWCSFYSQILTMLPFLEYVFSNEAFKVVRAAKRFLWNGSPATSGIVLLKDPPYSNHIYQFYLHHFWSQERLDDENFCLFSLPSNWSKTMFLGEKEFVTHLNSSRFKSLLEALMEITNWDIFKSFVDKEIIMPGWIKGMSRDEVMQLFEKDTCILFFALELIKHSATFSTFARLKDSELGIIGSIIVLVANYQIKHHFAAVKARLLSLAKMKDGARFNFTAGIDCAGPDVSPLDMRSSILNKISPATTKAILEELTDYCELDFDAKWFFIPEEPDKNRQPTFIKPDDFLQNLKDSFDKNYSPDEWATICEEPDMDSLGIRELALNLEIRIKRISFGIAEKIFASRRDSLASTVISKEAAFIQYLLPCFVAFFLKYASDSQVAIHEKKNYLSFVHRLIKSYENSSRDLVQEYEFWDKSYASIATHAIMPIIPLVEDVKDSMQFYMALTKAMFPFRKEVLAVQLTKTQVVNSENPVYFSFIADLLKSLQKNIAATVAAERLPVDLHCLWSCPVAQYMARLKHALLGSGLEPVSTRLAQSYTLLRLIKVLVSGCFMENDVMLTVHKIITARMNDLGWDTDVDDEEESGLVNLDVEQDARKLSLHQLMGILFYHYINLDKVPFLRSECKTRFSSEAFHLDQVEMGLKSFIIKDLWLMKQIVSTWLIDNDGDVVDLSLASYELAKSAPTMYRRIIRRLNRYGKIKMDHPGEFTFFPIKHCRWCGRVCGVRDFKVCKLCIENPEYPDRNLFCSEQCEDKAIAKVHREEHVQFLLVKLEIA